MSTLTKDSLAEGLNQKLNFPVAEAKELVEMLLESIKEQLETGAPVKISGFGSWTVKEKKARRGRNPKTGETIEISARRVVVFHASSKLCDAVDGKGREEKNDR